jgi:DNA-binding LytR/AlgR family response regulator
MFHLAICDNDEQDLEKLSDGVHAYLRERPAIEGRITAFCDPRQLCAALEQGCTFDAYLLDIMMDRLNGIELGRMVRRVDSDVPVIYTTSSEEFAMDAFHLHALRYLTKPVQQAELVSALDAAYLFFTGKKSEQMNIRCGNIVHAVPVDEISYVENREHTACFHLRDGTVITSIRHTGTFESATAPLPQLASFLQPHKSFLVNMRCIRVLHPEKILLDSGCEIPVAQKSAAAVKRKYFQFLLQEGETQ